MAPAAHKQGLDPVNCEFAVQPMVILMDNKSQALQSNRNSVTLHSPKFSKNPSIKLVKQLRDFEILISGASKRT